MIIEDNVLTKNGTGMAFLNSVENAEVHVLSTLSK